MQIQGRFQFHKGTIKTFIPKVDFNPQEHFNSIKVRLELAGGVLPGAGAPISIP